MGVLDSFFKKIAESKASQGGKWFKPGRYPQLTVLRVFINEEAESGPTFIAEHRVDKSESSGERMRGKDGSLGGGEPFIPNAPGSEASIVVPLVNPKAKGAQFGNVKAYILGLIGAAEENTTDEQFMEYLKQLCGDEGKKTQPMRGALLSMECWNKVQKEDKSKDITRHKWQHIPQTVEDIAKRRAELDGATAKAA